MLGVHVNNNIQQPLAKIQSGPEKGRRVSGVLKLQLGLLIKRGRS